MPLLPRTGNSRVSSIGSLGVLFFCTSSMLTGAHFVVGHGRALVYAGSVFVVLGLVMTSLCSTIWRVILAQGACSGFGIRACAIFIVSVAIPPAYFTTQRALAASNSSLGGILRPIIAHRLRPRLGFS